MKWVLNTNNQFPDLVYQLEFQVGRPDQVPTDFFITKELLSFAKPTNQEKEPFRFFNCHDRHPGKGQFSVRLKDTNAPKNVSVDVDVKDTVFRQISTLLKSDEFRISYYPIFQQTVQSVQNFFEGFCTYQSTNFNLSKVHEPQDIDLTANLLNRDGSNFVNVLNNLDQNNDYIFLEQYTHYINELMRPLKLKIANTTG